jgi:hypothetical protein
MCQRMIGLLLIEYPNKVARASGGAKILGQGGKIFIFIFKKKKFNKN